MSHDLLVDSAFRESSPARDLLHGVHTSDPVSDQLFDRLFNGAVLLLYYFASAYDDRELAANGAALA